MEKLFRFITVATAVATLSAPVIAQDGAQDREPVPVQFSEVDPTSNIVLRYEIRAGAMTRPAYFGSDEYISSPDFSIKFDYAKVRGLAEYGALNDDAPPRAFGLRGSLRFIGKRSEDDYDDLKGLADVDASLELGLGGIYRERNFEAFADARYGAFGHNSFVGELGMDGIYYPTDNWEFRIGPRMVFGSQGFSDTYFTVNDAESAASGLDSFNADGGLLGAGFEATARYRFNNLWGLEAGLRGDRLLNDAAASPITRAGSEDQFRLRLGVTREMILQF